MKGDERAIHERPFGMETPWRLGTGMIPDYDPDETEATHWLEDRERG